MNIFELGALLGIFAGAIAAYHFASPYGVFLGVLASVVGAVAGFLVGRFAGLLFLLPFEGAARLCQFLTTAAGPVRPPFHGGVQSHPTAPSNKSLSSLSMRKLKQKFMALSLRRQFSVLFVGIFLLGLPVVPLALFSPRRIFPEWSGWQFALFAMLLCAIYATLLAAGGVYGGRWLARHRD